MTDAEQREAARQFINRWQGYEKGETQTFWISLLSDVLGVSMATDIIQFEKQVSVEGQTRFIDGYISETRVLIEQKSKKFDLDTPEPQSGTDKLMTPYEQANRYNNYLNLDEKARWIVTCNFEEIRIYNMNALGEKPQVVHVSNLQNEYKYLDFLVKKEVKEVRKEEQLSIEAGNLVGDIYDALKVQYKDPESVHSLKSLNALCVRLVFCLFAEDSGVFGKHDLFYNYMRQIPYNRWHNELALLFRMLNTPIEEREGYDLELEQFPYVNGGLFADDGTTIPSFTPELVDLILERGSRGFDWKGINPTIFGAVFESTLNSEIRRKGGMHYTSVENIHKVIDPLFLNELKRELQECKDAPLAGGARRKKLLAFQNKLASIQFLDPACGSGNFLTETYLSLRRLENEILKYLGILDDAQVAMGFVRDDFYGIKVSIEQFHGIEINDFAVSVAKSAMWIAEAQMLAETKNTTNLEKDFLPLKTHADVVEENALRADWSTVLSNNRLDYIMGNPPFIGQQLRTKQQSEDVAMIFGSGTPETKLDYVLCWYKKTFDYIKSQPNNIKAAFVSTNSICQGESVPTFWKRMTDDGIKILFAVRSFRWENESNDNAAVVCVIVGFSNNDSDYEKRIYEGNNVINAEHINAYIQDAPDIWITSRKNNPPAGFPICNDPLSSVN